MVEKKEKLVTHGAPVENKSVNFREIYSNFSRVGMSPWDLTLVFGTINESTSGFMESVTAEAFIRLSPQQFKVLATSLPIILSQWERTFGEINVASHFLMSAKTVEDAMLAQQKSAQVGSKT